MLHTLPSLPYLPGSLAPYISLETINFHHGKHHQTYVDNLNKLIPGTEYESLSLEDIITTAPAGGIFNNAAQIWNHTFYFDSLTPVFDILHPGDLRDGIIETWGSIETFQEEFNKVALATFGSGWTWLVKNADGSLQIISTSNAATPMSGESTPLLTCDVWEHAYYIDYRNARAKYLENFWHIVSWTKVNERYESQ